MSGSTLTHVQGVIDGIIDATVEGKIVPFTPMMEAIGEGVRNGTLSNDDLADIKIHLCGAGHLVSMYFLETQDEVQEQRLLYAADFIHELLKFDVFKDGEVPSE